MIHNKILPICIILFLSIYCTLQPRESAFSSILNTQTAEIVFTRIYENNEWGNEESVSGPGSTLKETQIIRNEIPILFKSLEITTVLDAACGDFNWVKHIDLAWLELYIGIDIVKDLINKNTKLYSDTHKIFMQKNIISDPLPTADMILCRDCLVLFPYKDIWQTLINLKKSGARYLLTTTFPGWKINRDIPALGDWRPLNFELPPFNFPKPIASIHEGLMPDQYANPLFATKSLGLWQLKDIVINN